MESGQSRGSWSEVLGVVKVGGVKVVPVTKGWSDYFLQLVGLTLRFVGIAAGVFFEFSPVFGLTHHNVLYDTSESRGVKKKLLSVIKCKDHVNCTLGHSRIQNPVNWTTRQPSS